MLYSVEGANGSRKRGDGSESGSMIKTIAAGCLAVGALLSAQCASAADLSVAPLYKAPPPAMAPAYNWSGFYLGINGGGGWGHSNWDTSSDRIGLSGGLVGGTAGHQWEVWRGGAR